MSVASNLTSDAGGLQLGEKLLAKLTHESSEIRLRALEQVETRFIRCHLHGQMLTVKPVYMLKQLIRWFGHTPPQAATRVLSLLLDLLRSEYGDAIVRKMPYERLKTELEKVRHILRRQEIKRANDLLDELQELLLEKYNNNDSAASTLSAELAIAIGSGAEDTGSEADSAAHSPDLAFSFSSDDYEPPWTRASLDDLATMKSILDTLDVPPEDDGTALQLSLTHLRIKLSDYPAEYLLQAPHIFLRLLQIQRQGKDSPTLLHANRALIGCLKQLQRRIRLRSHTLHYAAQLDPPPAAASATTPRQLRVSSALSQLLGGCLTLLAPLLLESHSRQHWHLLELTVEALRTFHALNAPIPEPVLGQLAQLAAKLIRSCNSLASAQPDMAETLAQLTLPRLNSLIFNGLMQDSLFLGVAFNPALDKLAARAQLHTVMLDNAYLTCAQERLRALSRLGQKLSDEAEPPQQEQQLTRLKRGYSLSLALLHPGPMTLHGAELLRAQGQVCLVVNQLGSQQLLEQLFIAVVECTPLYSEQPQLRQEAEALLLTLVQLPDKQLRKVVFKLLARPVVQHFHAIMNRSYYLPGYSNQDLLQQRLLGVPLSVALLRQLLIESWTATSDNQPWCVDLFLMLLQLSGVLGAKDYRAIAELLLPLMPLLICRAVRQPQLQQALWQLFEPDSCCLDPPDMLRGNLCYMYHPDAQLRKEATARVAYTLQCQDYADEYQPNMREVRLEMCAGDLCLLQPPRDYRSIFVGQSGAFQGQRSLDALLRLLQTPDLKPAIHRSTLLQLNVLLQNWQAADDFAERYAYGLILDALHKPLKRTPSGDCAGCDPRELLLPVVSILLKLLLNSSRFRRELYDVFEAFVCLLRALFLSPAHEPALRQEVSLCLYQLLFHDLIHSTESQLTLSVDLSALHIPLSYSLDESAPPSAASEGVALEAHLLATHFNGDAAAAAQHWRLHVARSICPTPQELELLPIQQLDIRQSLKLLPADLVLVQATLVKQRLLELLQQASNCSSHEALLQLAASAQLFIVLLRKDVPPEQAQLLWNILHKYLRLAPANAADRSLHTALLELCLSCLRHRLPQVLVGLSAALETDPHHSFATLLQDRSLPLEVCQLLAESLAELLQSDSTIVCAWHGRLFQQLSALARCHFELRQLQHVRCLLSVLRRLSEHELQLSDLYLRHYCQHFVQLSSDLRTSTQTGAQWQRDCLHIVCQLHAHTTPPPPSQSASGSDDGELGHKVLRYLLGLCGHSDGEVRALAWVSLANWISTSGGQMAEILPRLDFLPGGLPACCLSTLLDAHEQMLVRQLAGRTFVLLLPHIGASAAIALLERHAYLREAATALSSLQLDAQLPSPDQREPQHACEIISCHVAICTRLVLLQPDWCSKLCAHAFVHGLSDVLKLPPPPPPPRRTAYRQLCVLICEFYAVCYQHSFEHLQRTVCRDPVLLQCFVALLDEVLGLEQPERLLLPLVKALLVFCKDANAYASLCELFHRQPSVLLELLLCGMNRTRYKTPLQHYTLAALLLLLIKAQHSELELSLLLLMEENEVAMETEPRSGQPDKENNCNAINKQLAKLSLEVEPPKPPEQQKKKKLKTLPANASVIIYLELDRLFEQLFPPRGYDFTRWPSLVHVQVCEALGVLLKLSPSALHAANHWRLLSRVLQLLDQFLNDPQLGDASAYVRRVGAHKSRDILANLHTIFNMLVHWHSSHLSLITDPLCAASAVRLLVRIWPWLSHSPDLKQLAVRLAVFLTEHSFELCKQTSLVLHGQSASLLQLMSRVVDLETSRREMASKSSAPATAAATAEAALRVMTNCCACSEGRLSLVKMNALDVFDTIMPGSGPALKGRSALLLDWLAFWEVFSRYEIGAKLCHVPALLNAVRRSPPRHAKRLLCLSIMRNMCFLSANRSQLVGLTEWVDLLRDVIAQPLDTADARQRGPSFEEHHLAVLCVWKLFGFGAKYKAMLRGTKLAKQLTELREKLSALEKERRECFDNVPYAKKLSQVLAALLDSLKD